MREQIRQEAREQRQRIAAGEPIPPHLRRYARRAGCGVAVLCGGGGLAIGALGVVFERVYWFAALFLFVLAGLGVLQVITGRHLITGRRDDR